MNNNLDNLNIQFALKKSQDDYLIPDFCYSGLQGKSDVISIMG